MEQTDCMGRRPGGWSLPAPRAQSGGRSPVLNVRRRDFISLLGGAAAAWPLAARAQHARTGLRIGVLGPSLSNPYPSTLFQAFLAQLRELGFSEGQNLVAEYQAHDDPRGPFVATIELMRSQPDLVVATGPEVALQALVGASGSVPIVFIAVNYDPIARGYVASLARPGGNITGVVFQQLELAAKQVELLAQAFPDRSRMAIFFDGLSADQFSAAERTATSLHLQIQALRLENPPYDFEAAFRNAKAGTTQMVLVLSSPFFIPHTTRIGQLAIEHHLPTMFIQKDYVRAGGLMSYGVDFVLMYRRAADYVTKILKGAKAGDLPVEQATKFEFVVNLKTARAIGIELPTAILLRADEVIE
jgi:putative ABC transport system substrate-binding protein